MDEASWRVTIEGRLLATEKALADMETAMGTLAWNLDVLKASVDALSRKEYR